MKDFDVLIDQFVEYVNFSYREPISYYQVPKSVHIPALSDDVQMLWNWSIKRYENINWLDALEGKLPNPFPKSFKSLITRYIFPPFEFGPLQFLANTPEGIDQNNELRSGIFADKHLSIFLLQSGFIQFGRVVGGSYDPICFDTNCKTADYECSVVSIDHETALCSDKVKITAVIASSFHELIEQNCKL